MGFFDYIGEEIKILIKSKNSVELFPPFMGTRPNDSVEFVFEYGYDTVFISKDTLKQKFKVIE